MSKSKSFIPAIVLGLIMTSCQQQSKFGYVMLNNLYDSFPMKKQYEDSLQRVEKARNAILDSLYKVYSKNSTGPQAEQAKQVFVQKREQFASESKLIAKHYDDEIWKNINLGIKRYGIKNKYQFIFGANGSGTIMFADSAKDVTHEVLNFMKEKK